MAGKARIAGAVVALTLSAGGGGSILRGDSPEDPATPAVQQHGIWRVMPAEGHRGGGSAVFDSIRGN